MLYYELKKLPVARAVAASSAFPGLLTPITLKNYPREDDFVAPQWVDLAVEDRGFFCRRKT